MTTNETYTDPEMTDFYADKDEAFMQAVPRDDRSAAASKAARTRQLNKGTRVLADPAIKAANDRRKARRLAG